MLGGPYGLRLCFASGDSGDFAQRGSGVTGAGCCKDNCIDPIPRAIRLSFLHHYRWEVWCLELRLLFIYDSVQSKSFRKPSGRPEFTRHYVREILSSDNTSHCNCILRGLQATDKTSSLSTSDRGIHSLPLPSLTALFRSSSSVTIVVVTTNPQKCLVVNPTDRSGLQALIELVEGRREGCIQSDDVVTMKTGQKVREAVPLVHQAQTTGLLSDPFAGKCSSFPFYSMMFAYSLIRLF